MKKVLFSILAIAMCACGSDQDDSYEDVPTQPEYHADAVPVTSADGPDPSGEEVQAPETDADIGSLEQGLSGDTSFGVSEASANFQFRCLAGTDPCYVPLKKNIQIKLITDGVPLNADRVLFGQVVTEAVRRANTHSTGFHYEVFDATGCDPAEVCLDFYAQNPGAVPAGEAVDSIRRYISYGMGTTATVGSGRRTFKTIGAFANWNTLKAYKGDTTCVNVTSDTCYNAMINLVLNALSTASGGGISTNTSTAGKGNDFDVDGNTGNMAGAPDLCRMLDYNASNPASYTVQADACGF